MPFSRSNHVHGVAYDWINIAFDIAGQPAAPFDVKLTGVDPPVAPTVPSLGRDRFNNWKAHHGVYVPPSFKPEPTGEVTVNLIKASMEKWLNPVQIINSPPFSWGTTTNQIYSTSTTNEEVEPVPAPVIVQEDMPILAHRWCDLRVRDDVGVAMVSLNGSYPIPAAGYAECHCPGRYRTYEDDPHGDCPHYDGTCGWYSVPADQMGEYHGDVSLLVELSGRVIECERGYRSQHQRVVEMRVPPCRWCRKPSTVAHFGLDEFETFTCDRHAGTGWGQFTLDDLAEHLGVQIRQQD